MRMIKHVMTVAFLLASVFVNSSFTSDETVPVKLELTFVDHLTAGLIEQDVFVEKRPGSGEVFRVLISEKEQYLDSEIYTTKEPLHHDPFDPDNAGPYKKGKSLDMTLRDWLSASGTASYTCEEGWGVIKAEFKNLVPNATYTMWHFFMPAPPTVPFTGTLDVPLGDRKGVQSVFKTDNNGNATLDARFEHCLQMTGDQLMGGLAVALHTDGKTYGSAPGAFGRDTHVHLFAMLPTEDDIN
ncbi:MAG: hypothetical protein AAF632_02115 [Bacteroidota bacterium]